MLKVQIAFSLIFFLHFYYQFILLFFFFELFTLFKQCYFIDLDGLAIILFFYFFMDQCHWANR